MKFILLASTLIVSAFCVTGPSFASDSNGEGALLALGGTHAVVSTHLGQSKIDKATRL